MQSQVTYLYIVGVGDGLREDSWDGWITAYFQIIFGALIPLKEISKMASWYSDKGDVIDRNHTSCQTCDLSLFFSCLEQEQHHAYRSPVAEGSSCLWLGE